MTSASLLRAPKPRKPIDQRLVLAEIETGVNEVLRLTCVAGPDQPTPVLTAYVWRRPPTGGDWYATPIGMPVSFDIVERFATELVSARAEAQRRGLVT